MGDAGASVVGDAGAVQDMGPPVAYLALREDTPVYDRDGRRIGLVDRVVADEPMDIFRGIVVHTLPRPGRHLFADADDVAELRERGVVLSVGRDALSEPLGGRPIRSTRNGSAGGMVQPRLRRAWDWLTGRH
jgi:hypothetical protein